MSGSVLLGQKQDDETGLGYTASVDNPRSAVTSGAGAGQALFLAGLSDVAVSTSADNYRFYVYEGKIYPHIIDPSDGKPADDMLFVGNQIPMSDEIRNIMDFVSNSKRGIVK